MVIILELDLKWKKSHNPFINKECLTDLLDNYDFYSYSDKEGYPSISDIFKVAIESRNRDAIIALLKCFQNFDEFLA